MGANIWDAIGNVSNTIGSIWGSKEGYSQKTSQAFNAEVTDSFALPKVQNSNMLMYLGIGGLVLLMLVFMKK